MSRCDSLEATKPKRPPCDLERLHRGAMPNVRRLHPRFALDAWSRPVKRIGGDVIAAWPVDDGRLVAFLGDVMGHGTPAAVVASGVRSALHHLRAAGLSHPAELLADLNRSVFDLFPDYFVTACCCLFDAAGTLACAVAGHPPLLVRSPGGAVEEVVSHSLPLGVADRPEIGEFALAFDAGSSVVIYSDGVSDALAGGPSRGSDVIAGVMRGVLSGSPEETARGIRRAIRRADRPREDDQSVLVVQRGG